VPRTGDRGEGRQDQAQEVQVQVAAQQVTPHRRTAPTHQRPCPSASSAVSCYGGPEGIRAAPPPPSRTCVVPATKRTAQANQGGIQSPPNETFGKHRPPVAHRSLDPLPPAAAKLRDGSPPQTRLSTPRARAPAVPPGPAPPTPPPAAPHPMAQAWDTQSRSSYASTLRSSPARAPRPHRGPSLGRWRPIPPARASSHSSQPRP